MLHFIANNSNAMLVLGYTGLMVLSVVWLSRRGWRILQNGTYYRTMFESVFRWNRVYRYGMPVYVVAWSSIGGAGVIVVSAISKLIHYPLEFPFWWVIPFEATWQGLPIPLLGYILAEWLYERQRTRKAKRSSRYYRHDLPTRAEPLGDPDITRLADLLPDMPDSDETDTQNTTSRTQQ
ncbi:MAG: hypothetical protein AAF787_05635 [Chloroflexota bacterium]